MHTITVPTGKILVIYGQYGKLECLSIGDYGKEHNIKADFLGLRNPINGVLAKNIMPFEEKWVITISSQYGCSMSCKFCDVPAVGIGVNATIEDMNSQIISAISSTNCKKTKRLNIHYARMGEPTFNPNVLEHAKQLKKFIENLGIQADTIHPVLSTMLPRIKSEKLGQYLTDWCSIKNVKFNGEAGLQLSINSTDDTQRNWLMDYKSLSLREIAGIANQLPLPIGRKYCLNFAITSDSIVDGSVLKSLFDSNKFMVKITPIHITSSSDENKISAGDSYIKYDFYSKVEQDLIANGFDVIVFVPSLDEDESMITCGNAILALKGISNDITLKRSKKHWTAFHPDGSIGIGKNGRKAILDLYYRGID